MSAVASTTPAAPVAAAGPRAAIDRACAALRLSVAKAQLEHDPLGAALDAMAISLGAIGELIDHVDAARQPLDADERAQMTRKLVQACRADFARAATGSTRRLAILSGIVAAALLLAALGGGYLWGRSTEAAAVSEASEVIRAALSDGSASARVWADAIRRNDLVGLLGRCEGQRVWTEANGRRACAVPLWLDDAPAPPAPAGPRS